MQLPKLPDFMKHFANEPWYVKLAALALLLLPAILLATSMLIRASHGH